MQIFRQRIRVYLHSSAVNLSLPTNNVTVTLSNSLDKDIKNIPFLPDRNELIPRLFCPCIDILRRHRVICCYFKYLAAFSEKNDLDGIERLALSFGLSIAVVPLIGLGLNFTPK